MDYLEEYKLYKTICGWKKAEAEKHECIFIRLMAKDIDGKASLQEKIAIRIHSLAAYNNVDHIPDEEIFAVAKTIINLTK